MFSIYFGYFIFIAFFCRQRFLSRTLQFRFVVLNGSLIFFSQEELFKKSTSSIRLIGIIGSVISLSSGLSVARSVSLLVGLSTSFIKGREFILPCYL